MKLTVHVYRGDMRKVGGVGRPDLLFDLSRTGKITISQSTPSQGSSDSREYLIEEITPDFVQRRITQFVDALAMK